MAEPEEISDEDMPSLTRPPREQDPLVHLREKVASAAKKLNEAVEKHTTAELGVESAQRLLGEAERDMAVRQAAWDEAIAAYMSHQAGTTTP